MKMNKYYFIQSILKTSIINGNTSVKFLQKKTRLFLYFNRPKGANKINKELELKWD